MGASRTYNVIAITTENGNGQQYGYFCMTRENMGQSVKKAEKEGLRIDHWEHQTKTGERMIKQGPSKVSVCSVCLGGNPRPGWAGGCPVCEHTGWCSPRKRLTGWADWQIEHMKREYRKQEA